MKWRTYPHFGTKLTPIHRQFIYSYVARKENVITHSFYPLIHKKVCTRCYKSKFDHALGTTKRCHSFMDGDGTRKSTVKERKIFYANHLDSMIFAYYAQEVLSKIYEEKLKNKFPKIDEAVLAYRKIPKPNGKNKSSIDHANDTFGLINDYLIRKKSCLAISLDISSFFDTLDHIYLKTAWKDLLGVDVNEKLPDDHYAIYRAITKTSYVNLEDVVQVIGLKHVNDIHRKDVECFCSSYKEFREKFAKTGKVREHPFQKLIPNGKKVRCGIPQGTPISAFLSNLYMFEFDREMTSLMSSIGGFYRRYSDDIVILCDPAMRDIVVYQAMKIINTKFNLTIQAGKTQIVLFELSNGIVHCTSQRNGKQTKFQYLGFDFDGNTKLIRAASISKFYRKMKFAIKRRSNMVHKIHRANLRRIDFKNNPLRTVFFKGPIYARYSYQGRRGANRNFLHYAHDAARLMDDNSISKQIRRSWGVLNTYIKRFGH